MHLLKKGIERDIGPSFDRAWKRMEQGKPGYMMAKVGGATLGALVVGDGVYNLIAGFDEHVDDLFIPDSMGRNKVRMFVGSGELVAGATALYMALTKGAAKTALL